MARNPLAGLAPRRRALVVGVLAVAVALLAGAAVRACTTQARGYPAQSRPGPVLLVPGYGGGQGALSRLADRIRATGRTVTVLTLPGDGTGDLAAQADTLRAAVARAGGDSVDVVGYSAGGVVVRLWVAQGAHALEEDDWLASLVWFTRPLSREPGHSDREPMLRLRVGAVVPDPGGLP